ncbi:MFS transporter [Nocardioides sp. SYSU DS0651]|uniref:MFS transporter n=1 Tax=Nocardioides sp. SYSU DS0651 TaxID=3415955 RepID=UPI003F4C9C27
MPGTERPANGLFATLAAIAIVAAVVSSLGAPLVPSIAAAHDIPISTAQWLLTATLISAAAATPVLGRWASGRARRPVVIGSLGVVLLGTVVSALPLGIGPMIAGRALQGAGLAVAPVALAVARDSWTGARLASRLSLLSVATVAGAGLGYPLTAVVAEQLGIAGAFWFCAVLVAATIALAVRHLPRDADGEPQPVDLASVALVSSGMAAVLLAVSQGESWGWRSAPVLLTAGGGLTLLGGWIGRTGAVSRSGGHPLVDLRLAGRRGLLGPHVVAFALGVGMYGLLTIVVLLVRADGSDGWGLGAGVTAAGLVLVPYSLMSVSGSRVALRVARRFGGQVLLPLGCAVFASSLVLLAVSHDRLWQALLAMAVGGLGSGFTFSSLAMLVVPHVPHAETGSALSFNQLLRYLGFSVGSAVSVALLQLYGGDAAAFRATALTLAGVCLAAGAAAVADARR